MATRDDQSGGPMTAADLAWELRKARDQAARLEERLDDLYWAALRLVGPRAKAGGAGSSDSGTPPGDGVPSRAAAWIARLAVSPRPGGALAVSVNSKPPFKLQPHLGALFLALAEDRGASPDEGVAFKSLPDLADRMAKRLGGRPPRPETINKYIWKLRKVLMRRCGLDAGVIETSRARGRRLAIRRPVNR
jgi:hypothetical protein